MGNEEKKVVKVKTVKVKPKEAPAEYSGTRDTSVRAFGNQHSGK